jgi:hypothetical protein
MNSVFCSAGLGPRAYSESLTFLAEQNFTALALLETETHFDANLHVYGLPIFQCAFAEPLFYGFNCFSIEPES